MTNDELRALADCLDDPNAMQRTARRKAADYLRAQADAQPVAWLVTGGIAFHDESYSSREAAEAALIKRDDHARIKPLYTHPAPAAPQAEPKREPSAAEWLSTDDAETHLAAAMRDAARIAPPSDDKAILDALKRRGIWLAQIGGSDE